MFARVDKRNKLRHNPVHTVDNIVLDPSDGDFSVTINGGQEHLWIQDEAVIVIANYIETQLKESNENSVNAKQMKQNNNRS